MKIFLLLVVVLVGVLFSGCKSKESDHVQLANSLMRKYAQKMKKEKGLELSGIGGAMMYKVSELSLDFISKEKLTIPEARKLYLEVVEGFIPIVNSDKKIRSYLKNYPFTHENIDFTIAFVEPRTMRDVDPPYVAHVFYCRGEVVYSFFNTEKNMFNDDLQYAEKYEDAMRIVQLESKND